LQQLGFDPCSLDDLAARTDLSIADLSGELMLMELDGLVEKHSGNVYSRCVVI
jgi:DNA processing protein